MSQPTEDHTRVIPGADREWIPLTAVAEGASFKVLVADPELHQVVVVFRFAPGTVLPPHTHKCHATAYTISGEWAYEGKPLPEGALAYEPVESTHQPVSESGAELIVILQSKNDDFLINHMPDGTDLPLDMAFFKAVEGRTAAEVEAMFAASS